jgi:DNA-binding CsgD family transcriptional regulator
MQTGSSVIIHISPIVQQGLKSILLSRNVGISDVMNSIPDCTVISEWKNCFILIDMLYSDELKKHRKVLKKNGNTIIGIGNNGNTIDLGSVFDDMLFINDTIDTIILTISGYISQVSDIKTDNQLSDREAEVLTMVAQGLSNKQIADRLFISIHTVITHRKNITFKLGIKSISGLTLYAALNNMIDLR